jgi:hypothetical protein
MDDTVSERHFPPKMSESSAGIVARLSFIVDTLNPVCSPLSFGVEFAQARWIATNKASRVSVPQVSTFVLQRRRRQENTPRSHSYYFQRFSTPMRDDTHLAWSFGSLLCRLHARPTERIAVQETRISAKPPTRYTNIMRYSSERPEFPLTT